jgi:uncharacterized membrane protein YuzA (DUF378 family)
MANGKGNAIDVLAVILVIVGAINWGLMAFLEKDLLIGILGLGWSIAKIIYIVIGVAGVWSLVSVLPKIGK